MGTYTPLDLNELYNAGLDVLGGKGRSAHKAFAACPLRSAAMRNAV